jgi:hypothetical protein
MENIYDTSDKLLSFDFSKLILSKPTLISGGNYFIRFKKENIPVYIQPPSCNTRNGFVKNGRKYYTDLLFTNEDEYIIQWFEKLEEHCIQYIYNRRNEWFDGDMEKADIENYFTSLLKIYKSGKFYSVRTNIPTALEKPIIKIYDEDENIVDFTTIDENTKLMNILEVQGIKCSPRSFQIEIEMKQALVMRPQELHLFDKCIIKSNNIPSINTTNNDTINRGDTEENIENNMEENTEEDTLDNNTNHTEANIVTNIAIESNINEEVSEVMNDIQDIIENSTVSTDSDNNLGNFTDNDTTVETIINEDNTQNVNIDNNENVEETTPIEIIENKDTNSMEEIDLTLEELPDDNNITLKNPNEVYYKMYRDAREKAKRARELALAAYLEAKNIKNTYMLDNIDDSDTSDLDIDNESLN